MKPIKFKDIFMYVLGALITIGFFVVLVYLIKSGGYKSELGIVLGALVASFTSIVGYFYGSSKGSSDKNEMLNNKRP